MYRKPSNFYSFMELMPKVDMRIKAQLADDLVIYLRNDMNSIVCTEMRVFVDNLLAWLTGCYFKIAQKSLEALSELIRRIGNDFSPYTAIILPHVIDRLGDRRDTVRDKAKVLLRDLMEHKVVSAQVLIDKLAFICFKHKNAKVREEFLQTIVNTLHEYGTQQLNILVYIAPICKLLGDRTVHVRKAAIQTLLEIYKHVGDRLRTDLKRLDDLPAAKLAMLEQKFDQVTAEGLLLPSVARSKAALDEADNISIRERPKKIVKRPLYSAMPTFRIKSNQNDASGDVAAVTMEIFEASFEQVPRLDVLNFRDMDHIYKQILIVISDKNADWKMRVKGLKNVRALLLLNYHARPRFIAVQQKELSKCFVDILTEQMRSQVIRETCITIAYMSKTLGNKLEIFCCSILKYLIQLTQNSTKVIASASTLALKYIIKYTQAPKLLWIYTDMLHSSKSKDIRATLCELMVLLMEEWRTKALKRHSVILRDRITKSLSDADSKVRRQARIAYWAFRRHFPDLADQIYGTLDIAAQRALKKEREGGTNNSQLSLESGHTVTPLRIRRSQTAEGGATGAIPKKACVIPRSTASSRGTSPVRLTGGCCTMTRSIYAPSTIIERWRAGVSKPNPGSPSATSSTKLRDDYGVVSNKGGATGAIPKPATGSPLETIRDQLCVCRAMQVGMYSTGSSARLINPVCATAASRCSAKSRKANHTLGNDEPWVADAWGCIRKHRRLSESDKFYNTDSDESSFYNSNLCSSNSDSCVSLCGSRNRLDVKNQQAPFNDIEKILQICVLTQMAEFKDGLISLKQYLLNGKGLNEEQIEYVQDIFEDVFLDTDIDTERYSIFLDTVKAFIMAYEHELHDWLFILLTGLFNNLDNVLMSSMHKKIWKVLRVVHESFPSYLQLDELFRIISDSTKSVTTRKRIVILRFCTDLVNRHCYSTDFPSKQYVTCERTVFKLAQMANDVNSVDVLYQACICIVSLLNLNTPQMTKLLDKLPLEYQETVNICISMSMRGQCSYANLSTSSQTRSSSPELLFTPLRFMLSRQDPFCLSCNHYSQMATSHEGNAESTHHRIEQQQHQDLTTEQKDSLSNSKAQSSGNGEDSDWAGNFRRMVISNVSDAEFAQAAEIYPENTPTTKEAFYYRRLFEERADSSEVNENIKIMTEEIPPNQHQQQQELKTEQQNNNCPASFLQVDIFVSDDEFAKAAEKFPVNTPTTKEAYYYRRMFDH